MASCYTTGTGTLIQYCGLTLAVTKSINHEPVAEGALKIGTMLDEALAYVGEVCEGKVPGDAEIGRYLSESIQAVPRLTRDQFEKLFGDSIQDVLLVMYLSNITKMQLMLAEKLGTVSLPI